MHAPDKAGGGGARSGAELSAPLMDEGRRAQQQRKRGYCCGSGSGAANRRKRARPAIRAEGNVTQ